MNAGFLMNDEIECLQVEQQRKKVQLKEAEDLRNIYNERAAEIGAVYEKLKSQKIEAKSLRNEIDVFVGADYSDFRGNNFSVRYQVPTLSTVRSYNELIAVIDRNLDSLNNEKMRFQGMALDQDGLVGQLTKALNWIGTQIENLVN